MNTPKKLVNLLGLARELRLPREWISTEANAGRIPCLRVGRKRLFNLDAVRAVLADRAAVSFTGGRADE